MLRSISATFFAFGVLWLPPISAEARPAPASRRVAVEYIDLSGTQDLSSAPFVSHIPQFHLWTMGKPAELTIQELAENGNAEFILGTAVFDTKTFRDVAVGLPSPPGHGRRVELITDAAHPMISGAWMLGHTNDGFAGIDAVNAFQLRKPISIDVYALDAGTEKDTEAALDVAALGGLGRQAENGVIARHAGIRGTADIPASFRFDPAKPIGRVTLTPLN